MLTPPIKLMLPTNYYSITDHQTAPRSILLRRRTLRLRLLLRVRIRLLRSDCQGCRTRLRGSPRPIRIQEASIQGQVVVSTHCHRRCRLGKCK